MRLKAAESRASGRLKLKPRVALAHQIPSSRGAHSGVGHRDLGKVIQGAGGHRNFPLGDPFSSLSQWPGWKPMFTDKGKFGIAELIKASGLA
jgi:hypothetical protein